MRISQVLEHGRELGAKRVLMMRAQRRSSLVCQPTRDGECSQKRDHAEDDEGGVPAEVIGGEAREDAADEAAERGAADVDAHDDCDAGAVPLLGDVGDGDGKDAGREESLHESPEDEGVETGRGGCEKRGHGYGGDGSDDDALSAEAFREDAEERCGESNSQRGGGDGESNSGLAGVKDGGEKREKGLGGIEVEEGADAAEKDRRDSSEWSESWPG